MRLHELVCAALERRASHCLDREDERRAVAAEIVRAIIASPDAQVIRAAFAHAPTSCSRLIAMRELGGAREADVLDAAARLAGLDNSPLATA